jgi:hypothetical protein
MEKLPLNGPFRTEKQFNRAFNETYRKHGWIVYKVEDIGYGQKWLDNLMVSPELATRYDVELKAIGADTVSLNSRDGAPAGDFETSQLLLMDELVLRHHHPQVAVWSKKRGDYVIVPWRDLRRMAAETGSNRIKLFF